jgi:hypothetical protein
MKPCGPRVHAGRCAGRALTATVLLALVVGIGTDAHAAPGTAQDSVRQNAAPQTAIRQPDVRPPDTAGASAGASAEPTVPTLARVRVIGVARARSTGESLPPDSTRRDSAGLGDIIVVRVQRLQDLVNHAKCMSGDGRRVPGCQPQEIALFLDGREIRGLAPESGAPTPDDGLLRFHLARTDSSDEAWADLLGAPPIAAPNNAFYTRPTKVSVGIAGAYALPTAFEDERVSPFKLIRIRPSWFVTCSLLLLLVLGLLCWLAVSSDILRDPGPPAQAGERRPYSLARFQMSAWFFLVIASFLYIWLITGGWNTLTPTVLGLIGIGAGTALGAAAIDASKRNTSVATLAALSAEKTLLDRELTAIDTQIPGAVGSSRVQLEVQRETKAVRAQLVADQIAASQNAAVPILSRGFLLDVMTDGTNGYSFHRFQMFTWTLALSVLFVYSVWTRLAMPDFNLTLLGLLGLSGGTYLGFKIPERQT